jgi:uncharacterized membrane protein
MPNGIFRHDHRTKETIMMGYDGMFGGGMWGMGLFGVLILLLVVLAIAALMKYLRR